MKQELSFVKLKKLAKTLPEGAAPKLLIMGNCATQHLATAIQGMSVAQELPLQVIDTDYDQMDVLTIDEGSELFEQKPSYVLIHMCTEKLLVDYRACADKSAFAEQSMERIEGYWAKITDKLSAKVLMLQFPEIVEPVYGNFESCYAESFSFQLRKLNYLLSERAAQQKAVFLIDLNRIALQLGAEAFRDRKLYYSAKMPLSLLALPAVAEQVLDVVAAIQGKIKKCVILDLDNTLWGGVIGDDGLEGIQIGELGVGHAFEALQHWLKDLKERGIILAVCSKNNEDTAKLPFEKHPEMVLRLSDIAMFVANWEDKASNIRMIQDSLNIGMDSIVFLDDNPFERGVVRSLIPDITVPELPEDPALYLDYLVGLNLFETAAASAQDKDRTEQYQAEAKRRQNQAQFASYDDYLDSLNMVAQVSPFDRFQVPRIAQLTQRSNQFNLRTVRLSEDDVVRMMEDDKYITLYFMLADRFGDHGLISLVILEKREDSTLFAYNWLMSCRVLKRGMEAFIINTMVETAKENGFARIIGEYIKTPKNAMVENIYETYGFRRVADNLFEIDVDGYEPIKNFIERA